MDRIQSVPYFTEFTLFETFDDVHIALPLSALDLIEATCIGLE